MFAGMPLNRRLLLGFCLVGLVPLAITCSAAYWVASSGLEEVSHTGGQSLESSAFAQLAAVRDIKKDQIEGYFQSRATGMDVLTDTVGAVRSEAFEKLVAVREMKRRAVQRYFETAVKQAQTFSENQMVAAAMGEFSRAFLALREQNAALDAGQNNALQEYYEGPFANTYRKSNPGSNLNAADLVAGLPGSAKYLQYQYIAANEHPLGSKHLLTRTGDGTEYSAVHAKYHETLRSYLEKFLATTTFFSSMRAAA